MRTASAASRSTSGPRSPASTTRNGPEFTGIDWTDVYDLGGRVSASRGEVSVLTVAASLTGQRSVISLGDLLTGLDRSNIAIMLDAIARTTGWHERGTAALVTGVFPGSRDGFEHLRFTVISLDAATEGDRSPTGLIPGPSPLRGRVTP